ncbi:dTDP-4-dehydrorhamnose reductase [Paenibacillus sacheonensis]|uniref:dTDP-4-dehydrorhamnose reductase n=1 Tax=Paenibacillus sacheonensis TaxID=742054 RepID=A0A7X5C3M6_9BACL|nr:dTDP-4-dehydrorhamnose reductase [Paenibacillus sacheonensis]MBM7568610.1 dTDP-4-dehydrorhamnose reductase [Paenibacillus sacheonensis]NBC72495.1 dTDP-4-dehydrorhamnose reductase [Paenibacillus sacheonensis]
MKILVTGATGQLGYDVVRHGMKRGLQMVGIGSRDLDLTKEAEVSTYIRELNPDAIVHCAAYTAVDRAEDEKEQCWSVNVDATKYLAQLAKEVNAKLLYTSTDYVFDGLGEAPFMESDQPSPIGYYGITKYEGEEAVKRLADDWFIVRVSWVFGSNGSNFVKTMLRLAETRTELNVVGDQVGSPTYTADLARLLIDIVQTDKYGVYHASNEGFCSWAEFAQDIFRQADKDVTVNAISTEDYPTRAVRPKNSRMSKQNLVRNGFHLLPAWQDAVKRYLSEMDREDTKPMQ